MSDMNALSKKEQKKLLAWYRANHYRRFHCMNAAINSNCACGIEDFYSYTTQMGRYALMHDETGEYYHVFWLRDDATTYGAATQKQVMRWIRERVGYGAICVADIRRIQAHPRHVFIYNIPTRDPHTGQIVYRDLRMLIAGTLDDAFNTYGYNLSALCNAGLYL